MRTVLVAVIVVVGAVTGCFGDDASLEFTSDDSLARAVGNSTADLVSARASLVPRNYTFPSQLELPQVVKWKNGTIGSETAAGIEDRNDRGGNHHGVTIIADDYASLLPAGQPVELNIKLAMAGQPGASADVDIFVDVPGLRTDFDPSSQDEFNWKFTAKSLSVSTIGVDGQKALIGIAVANGRVAPGQTLAYSLRVEATYVKDVLTPYHPWALIVPDEATGLLFTSAKADGPEHVKGTFVLVDPQDEPVGVYHFDEVYSATLFVPISGAGTYVFYAWEMHGGFLEVQADQPVPDRLATPLALQTTAASLGATLTPGLPARDWTHKGTATPPAGGSTTSFSVTGTFPLRIVPTIGDGVTGAADIRIASGLGPVAGLQRVLRYDSGEDSLGYTQDAFNAYFVPANLAKGEYTVQFTNDSPATELGYEVVTYVR